MSTSVISFPVGPWSGFASTSIEEVRIAGYEDPGFVDVGVAFPVVSTLTAGERGRFTLRSVETDGILPIGAFVAFTRDCTLEGSQRRIRA